METPVPPFGRLRGFVNKRSVSCKTPQARVVTSGIVTAADGEITFD